MTQAGIAQTADTYTFTSTTGTYAYLAGGTSVPGLATTTDDGISSAITLPFTFNFGGTDYSSCKVSSNGWLTFGSTTASGAANSSTNANTYKPILMPLWDDLQNIGFTPRYQTDGTSPNQIFKVEWQSEWNYASGAAVMSFQVWLYEGSNQIDFFYKVEADAVNSGSATIGIYDASSTYQTLNTGLSAPSSTVFTTTISSKPADGRIYRWNPPVSCSGSPAGGTAAGATTGCVGGAASLSASGMEQGLGISYQWESSSTGGAPWTSIGGATSATYSAPIVAGDKYYRLATTCSNSGQTSYSTSVQVTGITCGSTNLPVTGSTNITCGTSTQLYDNGGPSASYSNSCSGYVVLENSGTGVISLSGTYTYMETSYDYLKIFSGVGTGGTQLYTYNGSSGGTITPFSSAPGQAITVQFTSDGSGTGAGFALTALYSGTCALCGATPSSIASSSITTSGATLTWTEASPQPASGYDYYVSALSTAPTAGTTPTGGPTGVGVASASVSGLLANTPYYFWVRSNCGGGNTSSWVGPYTFTTLCSAITSLPYTENFDAVTTPNLPSCWTQNDANSDGDKWITYSGYSQSGSYSAGLYTDFNSGANNDYLISPAITLTGNQWVYWSTRVRSGFEPNDYEVLLSTTGTAPSDFTVTLLPLTTVSSTVYSTVTPIDLSAYTGPVYIAFHVPSGGLDGYYLYIDDFVVEDMPSCFSPTALGSTAIAATTASFSWTAATPAPSVGYQWEVRTDLLPGTGGATASGNVTGTTASATGLSANTAYNLYVRSDCGSSVYSAWEGPYSFTTLCNAITTIPYVENFDGVTTPALPSCWTRINNNADADQWQTYSGYSQSGSNSAGLYTDFNAGANDDYLISPAITLTGNQWVYWSHRARSGFEPNDYEVLLSTTGTAPADFNVTLKPLTTVNSAVYSTVTPVILSAYTGNVYIAFHVPSGGLDGYYLYIDDFTIEDLPACVPPSGLAATATTTSASVSWTAASPVPSSGYDYYYSTSNTAPGATPTPLVNVPSGTSANITGLTTNTTYYIWVRSNCGTGNTTSWVGPVSVFTGYCQPSPTSVDGSGITNVTFGQTTIVNNTTGTETNNYGDYSAMVGDGAQGTTLNVPITYSTGYTYNTVIWVDWNNDLDFADAGEAVYTGVSTASNPTTLAASFVIPLATPLGNYRMRIGGADAGLSATEWCDNGSYTCFEDYTLQVVSAPPCPQLPTALTSSAITQTTATVSWTAASPAPTGGYDVHYNTTGTAPGASPTPLVNVTSGLSGNLTGLTQNTTYYVWVRSDCSSGDVSNWAGPLTFTTLCGPISVFPYTENFDGVTTPALPSCWTQNNNNADADFWKTWSGYSQSGANSAGLYTDFNSGANDDYLISPAFTLTGNQRVYWSVRARSGFEPNDYEVLLSTTGDLPANFTVTLQSLTTVNSTVYSTVTPIDLSAYTGNVYIAFHVPSGGLDGYYLYMDDFVIEDIPACFEPTALTASATGTTTASLGWTAASPAPSVGYQWEVRTDLLPGTGGAVASGSVSGITASATGLSAGTAYNLYVRSDCGSSNYSTWAGPYSFTTVYNNPFCNTTGTSIPDNGCGSSTYLDIPIGITGAPGTNLGTDVLLDEVRINVKHTWDSDVRVFLQSPSGTEVELTSGNGSSGDNYGTISTCGSGYTAFRMDASTAITAGSAPFIGNYLPEGDFADYDTEDPNGIWHLRICDGASGDVGLLYYCELILITPPACPQLPTALTTTTIAQTTATVSWTAASPAPGSGYDVHYNTTGTAPGVTPSPLVNVNSGTSANLTGLTANTAYYVWVRSDCGSGDVSNWEGPLTFTTLCNAITTFPYTENFDGVTAPALANCWTQENGNADGDFWKSYTGYSQSGTNSVGLYTDINGGNNDDWLISPAITLTGNERVKWSVRVRSGFEPNDYRVMISTTGTDPGDFTTTLMPLTVVNSTVYSTVTPIDLSAYTGDVHIAFHVPSGGLDGYYLYIDDFIIEPLPSCLQPLSPAAAVTGTTSANLSWTAPSNVPSNGYEYYYSTSSTAPGATPSPLVDVLSGTSTTLTGLSAGTTYYYWVRSDCGAGDVSTWAGPVSFTTANPNPFCNTTGVSIPDNGCGSNNYLETSVVVSGAPGNNLGSNVILDEVRLNIGHTWDSDLNVYLVSPTGTQVELTSLNGGSANNYGTAATCGTGYTAFRMDAATSVTAGSAPFIGNYRPEGDFADFNTQNPNGVWKLRICDSGSGDVGKLYYFELVFDVPPTCAAPTNPVASNVTYSGATINWTASTTATVAYDYYVSTSSTAPTGATTPTGAAGAYAQLTGLSQGTTYYVWVRSDCGGGDLSTWAGPVTFTTSVQNDACANATELPCGTTALAGTTNGTVAETVTIGCSMSQYGVWYTFTGNGFPTTISTATSGFDIEMGIASGVCGSLTNIACRDAAGSTGTETYTFTTVDGMQYYVYIGYYGSGTTTGNFTISRSCDVNEWTGAVGTDWATAGNWSLGVVPGASSNASIPTSPTGGNFPVVNGNQNVGQLVVASGATVNVVGGSSLKVNFQLTNHGFVYVANNGSLVQPTGSALTNDGLFFITRNGSAVYDYWSSPITSVGTGFIGGPYYYDPALGTDDPSDDEHDPGWIVASGQMIPAKGYAAYGAGSRTFQGTVNNNTISIGVTSHALPNVSWNLIGNPYPSGVDVAQFLSTNSSILATGAIYLWDDPGTAPYVSGDYAVRNAAGGTAGGGGNTPTGVIGTAQGFEVKVNANGNVQFTNAMRTTGNTAMLFRQADSKRIWLNATSTDNMFNQTLVGFFEDGTDGEDWAYDAPKLNYLSDLSLFSLLDGSPYAIQGYGPLTPDRIVPLGLNSGVATTITIALDSEDGTENDPVYLEDRYVGVYQDLHEGSYVFSTAEATYWDRFFLHFASPYLTGLADASDSGLRVYSANGYLNLLSTENRKCNVKLMDAEGRVVLEENSLNLAAGSLSRLDIDFLSMGVYVVQVNDGSRSNSFKIIK